MVKKDLKPPDILNIVMKDFRVKKRNIDIAYDKAVNKLKINLCKELTQLYKDSWVRDFGITCKEGTLEYQGKSITESTFEEIWELYDRIFKKTVFNK